MKLITTCLCLLLLVPEYSVVALAATPSTHHPQWLPQVQADIPAVISDQVEEEATAFAPWESVPLPTNVTTATIHSLVVNPTDATKAFLATTQGLFETVNAGETWQRVNPDFFADVAEVVMASDNPARIYVRAQDFYRSDDGGATWAKLNFPPSICGLTVAPSQAELLYARRCNVATEPPLFRSSDGGQSWVAPNEQMTQTFDLLAVAPNQPDLLIATTFDQVFRSTDGGATWAPLVLGTRYAGRPVFDPNPPYTLYLGYWTGLLRSLDAGLTWQDSGADREFATLIVSPDGSGDIVGGSQEATWQFHADAKSWSAASWAAPPDLLALWRSATDSQASYALSQLGLWRQRKMTTSVPTSTFASHIFLPLVRRPARSPSLVLAASTVDQAIERANSYRSLVNAIPLRFSPEITLAAQNHADYYMANHADAGAEIYGAHGEVAGKPHYTGKWPSDRLKAAGFLWPGGGEVMHFVSNPLTSVDGWMSTIFHRVVLLDPNAHYAGYGSDQSANARVDVLDFGSGPIDAGVWSSAAPYPLAYPADGQVDVPPSWGGGESPDPLPPGAQRPVGYPFTLQSVGGKLQVDTIELRTATGQVVPVHPNPAGCASSCYALIAVAPLQPNTAYVVEGSGNVGGVAFHQQWHFTTGTDTVVEVNAAGAE